MYDQLKKRGVIQSENNIMQDGDKHRNFTIVTEL